jgi:hypothetical protein
MEILGGPPTPTPVKVMVSAYGTAFGSGDGSGAAVVGINNAFALQHVVQWTACANSVSCGSFPGAFNVKTTLTLMSNTWYDVIVAAGGGVSKPFGLTTNGPGTGAASGYADPYFQLAPNQDAYSLAFSAGIGNSPIPEPATWATLLLGLGVIGTVLRGRRRLRPIGV